MMLYLCVAAGLAGGLLIAAGLYAIYPPAAALVLGAGLLYLARCGIAGLPVPQESHES